MACFACLGGVRFGTTISSFGRGRYEGLIPCPMPVRAPRIGQRVIGREVSLASPRPPPSRPSSVLVCTAYRIMQSQNRRRRRGSRRFLWRTEMCRPERSQSRSGLNGSPSASTWCVRATSSSRSDAIGVGKRGESWASSLRRMGSRLFLTLPHIR